MKKLIPFFFLMIISGALRAQTTVHASTSYKELCYWNATNSDFDKCGDNAEYASMFTINADETMFTHVTNDIKSSYYVTKKDYVTSCSCYEYDVTSDVGNKYTFIVDLDRNMIKIMSSGHDDEKEDYLITFTIKSHWKE